MSDTAKKVNKSEQEWRETLTLEQYQVCRMKGTERAFAGRYTDEKTTGSYHCICCDAPLFSSVTKYDSGSGWPSFTEPLVPENVLEDHDDSHGMRRTEVLCAKCDAHLGHVFPDGPKPSGLRYCINSISLDLKPEDDA